MPTILPSSIESYQKMIDQITSMQEELGRIKAALRLHMQHVLVTPARRTPEEEVFYQLGRLHDPTASDIHNYAKWIDRATILSILDRLLASGQIRQRKTLHSTRYRITQD